MAEPDGAQLIAGYTASPVATRTRVNGHDPPGVPGGSSGGRGAVGLGSGGRIRTSDLWVMSPTSCHCSTPRHASAVRPSSSSWRWDVPAAASPPTQFPMQYSPALSRVTTGFGMGPGGATTLSATGTAHRRMQRLLFLSRGRVLRAGAHRPHRAHHEVRHPEVGPKFPSTIRTRQLQSVARCPPRAYQPGRLPGVSRH